MLCREDKSETLAPMGVQYGVGAVTVGVMARVVDTSRGTFPRHHRSKEKRWWRDCGRSTESVSREQEPWRRIILALRKKFYRGIELTFEACERPPPGNSNPDRDVD